MAPAPALGIAVICASVGRDERPRSHRARRQIQLAVIALLAAVLASATAASAQQRYAVIISGAAGGAAYSDRYAKWADDLSTLLVEQMKFDSARVTVLKDDGGDSGPTSATAANVRRAIGSVRRVMTRDDLLFVVLLGHGTFDGTDAKFNLVGPDLASADWGALISGLPGTVVLVNTTAASFPFLERLSGPRRVIVTATDTAVQRFDTVFPEYFIKAFQDEGADLDKNGRISIWEAFAAAADGVRRYYQQRGQLATERPFLDDNGDGIGREAAGSGEDGSLASRTYLDETPAGAAPTDEILVRLLQRRASLQAEIDDLKIRKSFLPTAEYDKEFERLMIDLARVNRDIRVRRGGS